MDTQGFFFSLSLSNILFLIKKKVKSGLDFVILPANNAGECSDAKIGADRIVYMQRNPL